MLTDDKTIGVLPTPATAQSKTTTPDFTSHATATEAQLALAGHVVHRGSIGDFSELQAFAKQLGVKP